MKKVLLLVTVIFLYGCTCLSQVPSKIIVGDTLSCTAFVPDIVPFVNADANCSDIASIYQTPDPGTPITTETILTVYVITDQGVESTKDILIVPLFLDSARITIDAAFFAYEDTEVFDMIRVFQAWIFNYPDRYLAAIDSTGELGYMNWQKITYPAWNDTLVFSDVPVNGANISEAAGGPFTYMRMCYSLASLR